MGGLFRRHPIETRSGIIHSYKNKSNHHSRGCQEIAVAQSCPMCLRASNILSMVRHPLSQHLPSGRCFRYRERLPLQRRGQKIFLVMVIIYLVIHFKSSCGEVHLMLRYVYARHAYSLVTSVASGPKAKYLKAEDELHEEVHPFC